MTGNSCWSYPSPWRVAQNEACNKGHLPLRSNYPTGNMKHAAKLGSEGSLKTNKVGQQNLSCEQLLFTESRTISILWFSPNKFERVTQKILS